MPNKTRRPGATVERIETMSFRPGIKYCKDCRLGPQEPGKDQTSAWCAGFVNTLSPVTGQYDLQVTCMAARLSEHLCGIDAVRFQPRN